jgi:hypothetical protein
MCAEHEKFVNKNEEITCVRGFSFSSFLLLLEITSPAEVHKTLALIRQINIKMTSYSRQIKIHFNC